jgi:type IX secretion system PorP/SprF family membrane protein
MKIKITLLFLMTIASFAQQDSQYTQYMYNTININPAYAGSRDILSVFLLHRNQWVGLDGAPVTNNFSINSPINESNFGIGLSFVNDKIGPTVENTVSIDASYSFPINVNYTLSFGLKTSGYFFNLDINKLNIYNQDDPQFQNIKGNFTPNFGAGIYFYSDATYFGLSAPNFFETNNYNDNDIKVQKEKVHYYFIAGHVFTINQNIKFKPALLTKIVEGAPLQADITANFLLYDKLTLGTAYRWNSTISGLVGFQISKSWFIGYGYDAETTQLSNYNSGSHELFLRFEIATKNRITSPRFF